MAVQRSTDRGSDPPNHTNTLLAPLSLLSLSPPSLTPNSSFSSTSSTPSLSSTSSTPPLPDPDPNQLSAPLANLHLDERGQPENQADQESYPSWAKAQDTTCTMFEAMQTLQECNARSKAGTGTDSRTRPGLQHSHTSLLLTTHHHRPYPYPRDSERPALPRRRTSPQPPASPSRPTPTASFAQALDDGTMPSSTRPHTYADAPHHNQPQSPRKLGRAPPAHQTPGDVGASEGDRQMFGVDGHDQQPFETHIDADDAMDTDEHASPPSAPLWNAPGAAPAPESGSTIYSPKPVRPEQQHQDRSSFSEHQDQQMGGAGTSADISVSYSLSQPRTRPRPQYMTRETDLPPYGFAASSPSCSYGAKSAGYLHGFAIPYSGQSSSSAAVASSSASCFSASSSNTDSSYESGYIPSPAPPTVLTPPPPEERGQRAPHEPFLSHAPPRGTEIRVETSTWEYRLLIRLPGYRRDSITLSSRRRRILHIVADSWEPGGGHLERRISFGYDADLSQVRAAFDGELLCVTAPRRVTPMTFQQRYS